MNPATDRYVRGTNGTVLRDDDVVVVVGLFSFLQCLADETRDMARGRVDGSEYLRARGLEALGESRLEHLVHILLVGPALEHDLRHRLPVLE